MLLRVIVIVGTLIVAASVSGQTPPDQDPLSGEWAADGTRLLQLKFDGTRTVTGTVFLVVNGTQRSSAPIKVGSYDPRSRTLKLTGEIAGRDGVSVPYVIEGMLDRDALDVAYTFGNDTGRLILKKC
jgi:hypothetical protein